MSFSAAAASSCLSRVASRACSSSRALARPAASQGVRGAVTLRHQEPLRQAQRQSWPSAAAILGSSGLRRFRTSVVAAGTSPETDEGLVELEIKVGGMMCEGCTSRVTEALQKAPGVAKVQVSLEKALASVEVKAPSQLEALGMLPTLVEAVQNLGFEAEPHIEGL